MTFSNTVALVCPKKWTYLNSGAFNVASKNDQVWIESVQLFPGSNGHYRIASLKDGEWIYER